MSFDLGTLNAKVALDASALLLGSQKAKAEFSALAAELAASSKMLGEKIAADAKKAADAQVAAVTAARKKLVGEISTGMLAVGTALAGALAVGVKAGADFEKKLSEVAANTNMTDAQLKEMTQTVTEMGAKTSAPLAQLADGYMHITNFGFKAGEATKLLDTAMKSAVSTGASTASTANILAAVMHGFGIETGKAAATMNVLHTAAALGNMTLEEFNNAAGPTLALAAALGVKLPDVAAAMAALTRHGFNAAEAATQVRNALAHIIQHSNSAQAALDKLGKASGINLAKEFTVAGLESRGLENAIKDLKLAAEKAGVAGPEAINSIIHAMRGGIGVMVLAGRGAADYKLILGQLNEMMAGKLDPTTQAYERTGKNTAFTVGMLKNNLELLGKDIRDTLGPIINNIVGSLGDLLRAFRGQSEEAKNSEIKLAAFMATGLLVTGMVGKLTLFVLELRNAFIAANLGVAGFVQGLGSALAMMARIANPITLIAGMMSIAGRADAQTLTLEQQFPDPVKRLKELQKRRNEAAKQLRILNSPLIRPEAADADITGVAGLDETLRAMGFGKPNQSTSNAIGAQEEKLKVLDKLIDGLKKQAELTKAAGEIKKAAEDAKKFNAGKSMRDFMGVGDKDALRAAKERAKEIADAAQDAKDKLQELWQAHKEQSEWREVLRSRNFPQWDQLNQSEIGQAIAGGEAVDNMRSMAEFAAKFSESFRTIQTDRLKPIMEEAKSFLREFNQSFRTPVVKTSNPEVYQQAGSFVHNFNDMWKGDGTDKRYEQAKKAAEDAKKQWAEVASYIRGTLESAFQNGFEHGIKGFFKSLLQGFKQVLEQMAAQWLAQQAIFGLIGGPLAGGKGGLFGSILGAFGFDDAGNDRTARRWGWDFAGAFGQGIADRQGRMAPAVSTAGAGGGGGDLHFHLNNPVINHPVDIDDVYYRLSSMARDRSRVVRR